MQILYQPFIRKQLVPVLVNFRHLGRARGHNLGHLKKIFFFYTRIICILFEQQVLFWADFLSVTLDLRVQGGARGQNLGQFYLSNHLSESFHICTIVTLEGWHSHPDSRPTGLYTWVGLEVKI